jgi:hypothetical protein
VYFVESSQWTETCALSHTSSYLLFEVPAQLILVSDTKISTPVLVFPLGFKSGHLLNDQVLGQKAGYLAAKLSVTCTWSRSQHSSSARTWSPDLVVISSPGQACLVPALTSSSGSGKRTCSLVTWSYLQNSPYSCVPYKYFISEGYIQPVSLG